MIDVAGRFHRLKRKEGALMESDLRRTRQVISILQAQKERILEHIITLEGYCSYGMSLPPWLLYSSPSTSGYGHLRDAILRRKGIHMNSRKHFQCHESGPCSGGKTDFLETCNQHNWSSHENSPDGTSDSNGYSGPQQRHPHVCNENPNTSNKLNSSGNVQVVSVKRGKVQEIQRDSNNKPILPLRAGVFSVVGLGRVIHDNKEYHSERYIYPVGYTVKRPYHSMVYPDKVVVYTCSIREGKGRPVFHVVAEDCSDKEISSSTATGAWIPVITAVSRLKKKDKSSSTSGPDNFGLSNPIIITLIQELDGARFCKNYVWKIFVEDQPTSQNRPSRRLTISSTKKPSQPDSPVSKLVSHNTNTAQYPEYK